MGIDLKLIQAYIADFKKKRREYPSLLAPNATLPIVWFGDSEAYFSGGKCIVTVGLNPSCKEFEADRFAPITLGMEGDAAKLKKTLDRYFDTQPYLSWFCHYGRVLYALGATYFGNNGKAKAIHIDMFSAIATISGWRKMDPDTVTEFANTCLFKRLRNNLAPKLFVFSGRKSDLEKQFEGFEFESEYPAKKKGVHLELWKRDDGTHLLFGTNGLRGPFEHFDDRELYGAIATWRLKEFVQGMPCPLCGRAKCETDETIGTT